MLVLDEFLSSQEDDILSAFRAYSAHRNPDAEAICDLAMYNYVEMRDLVAKPTFLLRKKIDNLLHLLLPRLWVPLYTSVTFTRMRYHACILNRKWQDKVKRVTYYSFKKCTFFLLISFSFQVLGNMLTVGGVGLLAVGGFAVARLVREGTADKIVKTLLKMQNFRM